jgi:protein-tyrosine phosphatase
LVDIHSHILSGLDDGARTLEDSVAMLRLAADSGTTDIVATPHANTEFTFDPELIGGKSPNCKMPPAPSPASTAAATSISPGKYSGRSGQSPKYAINHLCYLLVEFSDLLIPRTTQEIFDRLQGAGLTPIVTHPERNALLHTRLDQLQSWVENGALVQVTAGSLLGGFGRTAKSVATG